jgi:hypothetical protein
LKTVLYENACLMNGKEKILDQLKNNHNNVKTLIWPGDDFSVRGPAKSS